MHTDIGSAPYSQSFAERLRQMAARPKLDVQVCDHCNLRCAGCIHFSPLADEYFLDPDEYERDLERLAAVPGIEGYFETIVLMGGEPLLHPRIADVIRISRAHLPGENVALCTNGLMLKAMGDEFWDTLVENEVELGISPYPIAVDYEVLYELAASKGAKVKFTSDITRTASDKEVFMHPALDPDGGCDPARSFADCPFGGHYLQLSHGAILPCQVVAHHAPLAQRFGYDMHAEPDDRLILDSISSTDDIETFRRRPHPMCRFCDNDALTVVPWRRSELEADEWLAAGRS